jgi:hypothetical protein
MRNLVLSAVLISSGFLAACSDSTSPPPAPKPLIELKFFGRGLSASQRTLFTNAAARIQKIVAGPLPPATADKLDVSSAETCGATGVQPLTETISGIVIYASIDSIDGKGKVLAESGPCYIRDSVDFRTSVGIMKFDSADITSLAGAGSLQDVITHEMMHVLGFGSFWDSTALNLLINYGPNVSYVGAGGIAGCRAIGGTNTCANSVPVEGSQGGDGTINSHWRESTFGNELMTGFLNSGTNPLSVMSIRSLEDIGYTVDLSAADKYPDSHTVPTISIRDAFGQDVQSESPPPETWERPLPHRPRPLPSAPRESP